MLCPADTPEGEACGLVKNLALLAHITTSGDDEQEATPIQRVCCDLGVEDVQRLSGTEVHSSRAFLVFLNGLVLGLHTRPHDLVKNLRTLRRRGLIGEFVSVYLHQGQRAVHIATDGGRVCRPLIIVSEETGQPKLMQVHVEALASGVMTIRDLLKQGIVEYVDANEENNTLIAVTERDLETAIRQGLAQRKMRHTHLEVDPFTILGVVGGVIPVRASAKAYTVDLWRVAYSQNRCRHLV
jgi:DNA-directed RNA polymerase III subunit RPC2